MRLTMRLIVSPLFNFVKDNRLIVMSVRYCFEDFGIKHSKMRWLKESIHYLALGIFRGGYIVKVFFSFH